MVKKVLYALAFWLAMAAVIAAMEMSAGMPMTLGMLIVTLILGTTPPIVWLNLFGHPDAQTVAGTPGQ